jgi:hypothetical protein
MKKLVIAIALATLVVSPALATPIDAVAVMATLFGATIVIVNARMMLSDKSPFGAAPQRLLSQSAGIAATAGVIPRSTLRRTLQPVWRWTRPGIPKRPSRRAISA